ncbi:MAG: copper amine oxidase N-terminal domain-containing protein [Proteocatella sp.]
MKKKLSLFMALILTVSMMPFSAFALQEDDNVEIMGGIQEFNALDESQPVSILIDLGKQADLSRGLVEINLKNVRTARMSNPVIGKFIQDGKEVGIETIVGFEDKFDGKALKGNEDRFVMRFSGKDLNESSNSSTKLMITMNLDFSESKLGDADVDLQDLSETGFGNYTVTVADFIDGMQRDMLIKMEENTARIGEDGGSLSPFTITRFDTLDSVKANNEVQITLPRTLEFDEATTVKLDGKAITPTYNKEKNQMTIQAVGSSSSSVVVQPVVALSGTEIPYGNVEVMIDFLVNGRNVNSKAFDIGKVTDNAIELAVTEIGKTRIPQMNNGETDTVEVTLEGIKGSFVKDGYVDFKIEGIDVPYTGVTVTQPKGQIILRGESEGKMQSDLVNGKEVYQNGEFSMKVLNSDVEQIKFTMEITASSMQSGKAYITVNSKEFKTARTELADVTANLTVETNMSLVQKGTMFTAGNIVIKETSSGSLNTGDKLYFSLDKVNMGFDAEKLQITTTSGLEISKPRANKEGIIELEILRKSYNAPSRIEISGIQVYSAENVISGVAKLEIKRNNDVIFETDYVKIVGEIPNITVFTIGNKSYMASGVKKEAVEAPYIKNGYTMLPVRALAEALGLSSNWDNTNKVATFSNEQKIAAVKLGGSELIVNGTPIKLAVPAEVKNGTTMIELRSLATGFGVNIEWDNTQKTATVMNK